MFAISTLHLTNSWWQSRLITATFRNSLYNATIVKFPVVCGQYFRDPPYLSVNDDGVRLNFYYRVSNKRTGLATNDDRRFSPCRVYAREIITAVCVARLRPRKQARARSRLPATHARHSLIRYRVIVSETYGKLCAIVSMVDSERLGSRVSWTFSWKFNEKVDLLGGKDFTEIW